MKLSTKEFLRKCQFPLLIVFATFPIPLFLYAAFAPELLSLCWLSPAAYVLFVVLSLLVPGKGRLIYGIAATVLLAALGISALLVVPNFFLLGVPVLYGVLLLWSLPMAGWSSSEGLPFFCYWGGILLHVLAQVLKFLCQIFSYTALDITAAWLLISFFVFAALAMVSLTQSNLFSAANGRQAPVAMQRKNLILTLTFFSAALVISLMPSVINAIRQFIAWLAELLYRKMSAIDVPATEAVVSEPSGANEPMMMAQGESGLLTDILNAVFLILGSVLTIGVLIYVVRILIKALRKLIRHFLSGMSDYAANVTTDYIDEITDTRTFAPKGKKPRFSAADERAMTPQERVRYRYLRLLYKHPQWISGSTARENLPPEAASVYERARYSSHPVTQEDAARFVSKTKRI